VHSLYRPGTWLTGDYWDEMLVLALAGGHSPPRSVAILGNAAGTTARAIGHYFPGTSVDAVEIDPALTDVGRELFGLTGPKLRVHTADARPWLQASTQRFDVIMVDAYRQPYIPFYLATREFFSLVRDHLAPGGLVVINVGHPEQSDALEKVLSATMRAEFGRDFVWRDPAEPTNSMLVGTTASDPPGRLRAAAAGLPAQLGEIAVATADRLAPALTGGPVYTDDRAPVEWLVDTSLAEVAE
jgi:spermidine synthase